MPPRGKSGPMRAAGAIPRDLRRDSSAGAVSWAGSGPGNANHWGSDQRVWQGGQRDAPACNLRPRARRRRVCRREPRSTGPAWPGSSGTFDRRPDASSSTAPRPGRQRQIGPQAVPRGHPDPAAGPRLRPPGRPARQGGRAGRRCPGLEPRPRPPGPGRFARVGADQAATLPFARPLEMAGLASAAAAVGARSGPHCRLLDAPARGRPGRPPSIRPAASTRPRRRPPVVPSPIPAPAPAAIGPTLRGRMKALGVSPVPRSRGRPRAASASRASSPSTASGPSATSSRPRGTTSTQAVEAAHPADRPLAGHRGEPDRPLMRGPTAGPREVRLVGHPGPGGTMVPRKDTSPHRPPDDSTAEERADHGRRRFVEAPRC